ncbi:Hpt domain-containing protein [Terrarubrum flagellatum]|uniref:Hpt domain-containing protein n=1 Tax=Terrirubrum flagellatum TaxID=2895980 RepID=UPI0031453783
MALPAPKKAASPPDSYSARDLDLVHLARQTAGDRVLEREVLGLFRDQTVRMLAAMAMAVRNGRQARDAAHTLKGAARGVGAFRVADLAEIVETAGDESIASAVADLSAAAEDARNLIDRLLAND